VRDAAEPSDISIPETNPAFERGVSAIRADDVAAALTGVLFASAAGGVGVIDREMRYVIVNDALAEMNGRPAAAHVGLSIHDVIPYAAPTLEPVLQRVLETGMPIIDLPIAAEHPPGVRREFLASYYPVRDGDGQVVGVATIVLEHLAGEESERRALAAAAREADRARVLQRITTSLNEATTSAQVASAVVEDALPAIGADAGSLLFVVHDADGRPVEIEAVRISGFDERVTSRYPRFAVVAGRPVSDLVLTGRAVFAESPEAWSAAWPAAPEDLAALGFNGFAAVPVKVGDRVIAALSFTFRQRRKFDDGLRVFLATLAEQCALALERVRLHEAEVRAAARQAAILDTIQDGFVVFDRELRYTYVNARAETLLDRKASELIGRRLGDVFPQAVDGPVERAMQRLLATGETQQVEAFSALANSWIEARLYPAPDGLSLVFRDVTARRRRQDAIAFLADASRQLAASLDYQQTIRAVASAAVPALGDWCVVTLIESPEAGEWPPRLERVAVVHNDPRKLALAEALTARYPIDWSAESGMPVVLKTGVPTFAPVITDQMLTLLAQDAEHLALLRALEFSAVIIVPLIARGVTLGALTLCMTESGRRYDADDLALAQDLAQRQALAVDNARLFMQAERARAEAEAANHAKSEFLAVMSHELRTPLNAIGGYAQLLDMGIHGPVTDEQRSTLERIRKSQVHLTGIINEVLNFARLESGTVAYDIRPIRIGEMVAEVVPLVEPQRVAKRLELVVRLPEGKSPRDAYVLADPDKLQQVLLNLLSNAVKFTPPEGRVGIELEDAPDEQGMAVLRVVDTGIGIPDAKLESIFEPFVQVDRSLSNPGEGTGLGLAISRELARGMGGDLSATSTLGAGSTFTLRLPRA
jgi:PAS domain S-box-containing protein